MGRDTVMGRIRFGAAPYSASPQLKDLPSIPYVSKYPAISSVPLFLYVLLIIYLKKGGDGT